MTSRRRTTRALLARWNVVGWLVVALAIGLWELAIQLRWLDFTYISPPSDIAGALEELGRSGQLATAVAHTVSVALRASLLAMLIGTIVGVAFGLIPWVRTWFSGSVDFLRTVPTVALFPVVLLMWGPSDQSEIAVATYAATWPIILNAAGGVQAVPGQLRDVARVFGLSRWDTLRKVLIPAAMPAMLVGFRLAVVTALIVTMVAEMVINPEGVGWELLASSQALRPDRMWAYAIVAGLLGYLANMVLVQVAYRLLPGSRALVGGAQ